MMSFLGRLSFWGHIHFLGCLHYWVPPHFLSFVPIWDFFNSLGGLNFLVTFIFWVVLILDVVFAFGVVLIC